MMTLEKYYEQAIKGQSEQDAKSHIDWLNSYRQEWMSDDQWLLALFLCRLFSGFHHSPEIKKQNCGLTVISVNVKSAYFANYDYDYLTKMVIMAHNWGVRCAISGSGSGMFNIALWKRHKRDGGISERMPTIGEMVELYKDY